MQNSINWPAFREALRTHEGDLFDLLEALAQPRGWEECEADSTCTDCGVRCAVNDKGECEYCYGILENDDAVSFVFTYHDIAMKALDSYRDYKEGGA